MSWHGLSRSEIAYALARATATAGIVDAVARSPGIDKQGIALSLSQAAYQLEPHLDALRDGGILTQDEDAWNIAPGIGAVPDGEFLHLAATTRSGESIELRFHPEDARDD